MFRISAITRVGLVAVACVAVAAPSALAKTPPSRLTRRVRTGTRCPTRRRSSLRSRPSREGAERLYGYARYYMPTKATGKAAKPAKLYWYAMSYTPTKATRKAAKPATQTAATPSAPLCL